MARRLSLLAALILVVTSTGLINAPPSGATPPWESWTHDAYWRLDRELADPSVVHAGQFHGYGTTAKHCVPDSCVVHWVPRFVSGSLRFAANLSGDAMPERPAWVSPSDRDIWAPSVARIGTTYTMYFTATSGRPHDGGMKCLGLARSVSPAGPFRPEPEPLRCTRGWWNIDPYFVQDGARLYLLWREDDPAHRTGKVVGAELRPDGLGFAGEPPRVLMTGSHAWEAGYRGGARTVDDDATTSSVAGERRLPHTAMEGAAGIGPIENPAIARHPATGEWLLTWSANRWETQDYATGLAVCPGPLGPCQRRSLDTPWLRRSSELGITATSAEFGGVGGLSFVSAPDGQLYGVFHAYRHAGHHPSPRIAWVYRIVPNDGYRLSEF